MLIPFRSSQFKRDIKLALKRGKKMILIKTIMDRLTNEEPLESRHRDHKLAGTYKDHRECHIEPDWLLIYRITAKEIFFRKNRFPF